MGRSLAAGQEKYCERCKKPMQRKRYNGRLEDLGVFKRRKYCSLSCSNTKERPRHWETYHYRARKHRKLYCEACGSTENLHAHHVDGQPKNNNPENIQTLCAYCHNFLHATANRLGWIRPGRLPEIQEQTGLEDSETPSSHRSPKSSDEQ